MPKTCTSCGETYPDSMVFCPKDGTSLRLDEVGSDLIGTVIADRYLVSRLLGEGGMGKVYHAKHVRLPQQAAIKVLHNDMVKDAGAVARFTREAINAARIEHDRVARVFDAGETSDGTVYIAMEFVPGQSLRSLIDEARRLPPVRAANIAYQVAEGLEAAHKLTIVHRDLKPDNILVTTDENGADRCKVVDFGIAKANDATGTQLTQMGMLVGTPEFMSPEQVLGEPLDGRSDVYALALVAYEMLTGELPFEGNTPERKLTARLIQDPKPLVEAAPDVDWPEELQAAFDRAFVREPEGRTPNALGFADELVNAVEAWTGVSVLRQRTPISTTAIMGVPGEGTGALPRPTPRPTSSSAAPNTSRTPAPSATASRTAVNSPKAGTPGAGTSASKSAIPEPQAKKTPVAAIAAAAVVIAAVGGYFAFAGRGGNASADPGATTASAPVVASPNTSTSTPPPTPPAAPPGNANVPAGATKPVTTVSAPPTNPPAAAPPPAAPTSPNGNGAAGVSAAAAAEARRALNGIGETLLSAPDGQESVVAKRIIPQLKSLLPQLSTATDSTWAYIYLANAHGMADEPALSCQPFREAKRLASTEQQRLALRQLSDALTCAP